VNRPTTRIAALAAGVLLLAGCGGFRGAYSLNLPGGADLGDDPYSVTVQFLDVLDLVPQSGVRVADVPVGRVDGIELNDDWTAEVTLTVNGDVELPENAVAMIQQSSLLGEKYVELAAPGT
jgi:phospholipid/cholesterol/gamma-HCH transport system substrate-binding protein